MSDKDTIYRQDAIDAMCLACGLDCDKSKFVYNAPQDEQVIMCPEHYALSTLPLAEPPSRCVAKIEISKEDIEELVAEKVEEIKEILESQSEQKKGKWIYGEKSGQDGWYCSECGGFIPWYYDFYGLDNIDFIEDFKTCPFCDSKMVSYTGSDMREGEEDG